jgi:hypothetical protein
MLRVTYVVVVVAVFVVALGCGKKNADQYGYGYQPYNYPNDPYYNNPSYYQPNTGLGYPGYSCQGCGSTYGGGGYIVCPSYGGGYNPLSACANSQYMPAIYSGGYIYPPSYYGQVAQSYCGGGSNFSNCLCGSSFGANASFYGGNGQTFGSLCGSNGFLNQAYGNYGGMGSGTWAVF